MSQILHLKSGLWVGDWSCSVAPRTYTRSKHKETLSVDEPRWEVEHGLTAKVEDHLERAWGAAS